MSLARWLPGVAQLLDYPRGALKGDLASGISVCVVMVPSVLAYAELAGVPPQSGLYAALAAMIFYALFTSTRRIVVGPDTTIALIAGSVVIPLSMGDPARAADLAALLALMTGTLLLVAGRIGLGDVADLLSTPVLVGYAAGAALLLVLLSGRLCQRAERVLRDGDAAGPPAAQHLSDSDPPPARPERRAEGPESKGPP